MCTKPEQKILPNILIFSGTWRLIIQSPKGRRSDCSQRSSHTWPRYWIWRRGLVCQVPCYCSMKLLEDLSKCSPHFPLSVVLRCPSLSTPAKNRELQSLPFIQAAENGSSSTIITEHKRAVFSFFAPHGSGYFSWYQGPPLIESKQSCLYWNSLEFG